MRFVPCPRPESQYVLPPSGRGAVWLARPSGGRKAASSNLAGPTNKEPLVPARGRAVLFITTEIQGVGA